MQKLLFVSFIHPYPLKDGGTLAQYYFVDGLKNDFELHFCTIVNNDSQLYWLTQLKNKQPKLNIHYLIRQNLSSPQKHSFLKNFYRNFKKSIPAPPEPNDDFLDPYYYHVDKVIDPSFINFVNDIISQYKIDIVQFDFYDTIDLVFSIPKNIKKVFVNHEVRFKRLELSKNNSNVSNSVKRYLIEKNKLYETGCLKYFDEVIVFNRNDYEQIVPFCNHISISPFAVPEEMVFDIDHNKNFDHFLFMGAEGHTPNAIGLKFFLDEIYIPNLSKINLPILITGTWSDSFVCKYKKYTTIRFLGVIPSIKDVFEHAILINPITTGAGIRTKVLHALANRVPVFSTPFGAEGCYESLSDKHIGFFNTANDFINVFNQTSLEELSINGNNYYNRMFEKTSLIEKRIKALRH